MHGLHAFIGVCAMLIYGCWALLIVQTNYDNKFNSKEISARANGKAQFDIVIYKMILTISYIYIGTDQFIYIILVILMGGSIIIFQRFHFNSSFYHERMTKLWDIFSSLFIWSCANVCVAKLMEGNLFNGTVVMWLIGIPFIIIYILTQKDQKIEYFLQNSNKFTTGEELLFQILYLTKLI